MPDPASLYSKNILSLKDSVISDLLKLTQTPDIISLAGGLPAPEIFPVADLRAAADRVFDGQAAAALQYGPTEGDRALKAELIEFEAKQGVRLEPENLIVVSASQQALDMCAKIFLDPGDCVLAERPTYLGTIQAVQSYQGRMLGVALSPEKDGMDMADLERVYAKARRDGDRIKFIYVIPDFQNPSGVCWSLEKRKALLDFAYREDLLVVEDSPYREIRFLGESLPSLYQLDQDGRGRGCVVNLKTFSKILVPGARMGWVAANPEIVGKFVFAKQAMDLCTNIFAQKWLAEYLATGKIYALLDRIRALYRDKRTHMVDMLDRYMPKRPDISWTRPEGGLFLWITLPAGIDTGKMLKRAIDAKVAYVVGSAFYFDEPEHNSLRVNFSYPSKGQIEEGVKRLAKVVESEIARL